MRQYSARWHCALRLGVKITKILRNNKFKEPQNS